MPVKNPELLPLFDEVKELLAAYSDRLSVRVDEPGRYELWSDKPVVIDGRPHKDVYFAGLVVQKHFVGFYFMPVYTHEEAREFFGPELLGLLKGKSCFHLKKLTPEISSQIVSALDAGYRLYLEHGWI
jgi:hypothetical protein